MNKDLHDFLNYIILDVERTIDASNYFIRKNAKFVRGYSPDDFSLYIGYLQPFLCEQSTLINTINNLKLLLRTTGIREE
jgi:hypothetical protein